MSYILVYICILMVRFFLYWSFVLLGIEIFVGLFLGFEGFEVFFVFDLICCKEKLVGFGFERLWLFDFVFIIFLVFELEVELRKVFDFFVEVVLLFGFDFKDVLFIVFCFKVVIIFEVCFGVGILFEMFEIIFLFEFSFFGLLLIFGVEDGILVDEE